MPIEHALAGGVLEVVVVVRMPRRLVARDLAKRARDLQLTFHDQLLDLAVHGGQLQARHSGPRSLQYRVLAPYGASSVTELSGLWCRHASALQRP